MGRGKGSIPCGYWWVVGGWLVGGWWVAAGSIERKGERFHHVLYQLITNQLIDAFHSVVIGSRIGWQQLAVREAAVAAVAVAAEAVAAEAVAAEAVAVASFTWAPAASLSHDPGGPFISSARGLLRLLLSPAAAHIIRNHREPTDRIFFLFSFPEFLLHFSKKKNTKTKKTVSVSHAIYLFFYLFFPP